MKSMRQKFLQGSIALALAVAMLFSGLTPAGANPPEDDPGDEEVDCILIYHSELDDDSHTEPDDDCPPPDTVTTMLAALESYAEEHGSYRVEGGGYHGGGTGWGFWEASNYPVSITNVLIDGGHLPAGLLPDPYAEGDLSGTGDVMVYPCGDRVGVFTIDERDDETSAADSEWWTDNDCARYPIDSVHATYFKVSDPVVSEEDRRATVDAMIVAIESYGRENGSHIVEGGGTSGNGVGWVFYENAATTYPVSIANVLIDGGHLDPHAVPDPFVTNPAAEIGDVMVYWCGDRAAVFTRDAGEPSHADAAWWADNDCNRYAIDNRNATYFRVSRPLP